MSTAPRLPAAPGLITTLEKVFDTRRPGASTGPHQVPTGGAAGVDDLPNTQR
jgi:hypothetical protein